MIRSAIIDLARVWRLAPVSFSASATCSWIVATTPALLVALTAQLVNEAVGLVSGDVSSADRALIAFLQLAALTILARVGTGVARYLQSLATLRVNTLLAERVMSKGTRMALSSYENPDHYNALRRASAEVQSGRATQLVTGVISVVGSAVTVIAIAGVLAAWNPLAALLAVLSPVPAAWASVVMNRRRWRIDFERADKQRMSAYLQWLSTNDQTFKEVSHYRIGTTLVARYSAILRTFMGVDRRFAARSEGLVGGLDLLGGLGSVSALGLAVWSSIQARDVGQLAGFAQSIGALQGSTTALLLGIAGFYQVALYSRNLFGFLEIPDAPERVGGLSFPSPLTKGIEFRAVRFRYPGTERDVLGPISFSIPAGTSVALVGRNGAGKSTLVKLLCGLYEPTSGEILVDGEPLSSFSSEEVRRGIGVVFQDFVKFELTVEDSIKFGAIERAVDHDEIERAAHRSGIADRIEQLGKQYETLLGRRFAGAEQLSIGEWQRLALARCVYSGSPLRILDEPSASLDPLSEQDLVSKVLSAAEDATTVVVAHRFATIRACDKILLIHSGEVVEEGTHRELMARDNMYAEMYRTQAASFREGSATTEDGAA